MRDYKYWLTLAMLLDVQHFVELVNGIDIRSHRDIGDALKDDFHHHRYAVLLHQFARLLEGRNDISWFENTDRLATQTFNHRNVIHTITIELRRIDVFKRQLHTVIH